MALRALFKVINFVKGPGAFRLFLALLVVFHHATKYIKLGEFAVYVFFMLSGYWISKMYNEKYSTFNAPFLSFICARWFRIYPTYLFNFILLLLFIFLFKWSPDSQQAYANAGQTQFWISSILLFGYNQLPEASKLLVPAWSLDLELQFYLVFPFLFVLVRRFNLFTACVFVLITEVCFTVLFYDVFKNSFLPSIHFFMIGMVLYYTNIKPSKAFINGSLVLFTALLSINYYHPVLRANMFKSNRDLLWMGLNYHWLFSTLLAISVIPIVAINVRQKSSQVDRYLGNLSYDVYLFHWVMLIPYNYFFSSLPFVQRLPYFFIYLCLVLLGALLMQQYISKPVEALRSGWFRNRHPKSSIALALNLPDRSSTDTVVECRPKSRIHENG